MLLLTLGHPPRDVLEKEPLHSGYGSFCDLSAALVALPCLWGAGLLPTDCRLRLPHALPQPATSSRGAVGSLQLARARAASVSLRPLR